MFENVIKTSEYIKNNIKVSPKIAIILGSGLGDLVELVEEKEEIKYEDIPNFPVSTVAGHTGKLVLGISCITNMATGIQKFKHSHDRVVETAKKSSENLCNWVSNIIKEL